jgi:hypothetical protein
LRLIKASLVVVSTLFSSLFILWLGAQTRPDHGSWSWPPFWDSLPIALVASAAMFGAGTHLAVTSKKWSLVLSLIVPMGISLALRIWTWPSFAFFLPGACASFILAVYPRAWRWIVTVSVLLAAWWFGVMAYSFYDHFRPEPTVRGGLSIAMLLAVHFLMIGSSAVVILLLARTSGGPGVRDGVPG